ncbi:type II secretion system F family protein [Metallosphaera tengchongensis]|uniref:Type II secretion system F family protein n=1 Tax=Metallosphaera tengchongensis TaxID=1532350 RepID=A0A6N0NUU3_9CREN|nr:type II secretion system F family protein [Metallosphaera tengchongensis]QKR00512.1 type II secretion system F family protein [Metallosphaera tengchongensis]
MAFKGLKRGSGTKGQGNSKSSTGIIGNFYDLGIVKSMSKSIERKLLLAGMSTDPRMFAAQIFFYLIVSSAFSVLLAFFGIYIIVKLYLVFRLAKFAVLGLMFLIFAFIIPPVAYLLLNVNISQAIENRRIGIDAETAAFSAVFSIFLKSGLSPRILFERISKTIAFNYITQLTLYVSKRINFLGESVEDALLHAVKISPSKMLNDFIVSYVSAVRSGAPVLDAVTAKAKDILKQLELSAAIAADKLSGVGETYVIWLASGYITFFLILLLQALFPSIVGASVPLNVFGAILILILPLVDGVFILLVEQSQLRFPERKLSSYKIFYITLGIGFVAMFVMLGVTKQLVPFLTLTGNINNVTPTVISMLVGLLIATIPPAIITSKELKEGTGYDPYVVNLLRAISEGIRAGLSPEAIIKNIKDSPEMGRLSNVLKEIYAYLSLGYPLRDAFIKGAERILDFTSRISLVSMADMIDVGSMTPDSIESLAEQVESQIKIKREYESKIKILLYTPYIGVIISIIAVNFLSAAILGLIEGNQYAFTSGALGAARVLLPQAVFITAIASMINAFFAGLLVGKLGRGKVASGFVHAAVMVTVTAILMIIIVHIHFTFGAPPPQG